MKTVFRLTTPSCRPVSHTSCFTAATKRIPMEMSVVGVSTLNDRVEIAEINHNESDPESIGLTYPAPKVHVYRVRVPTPSL